MVTFIKANNYIMKGYFAGVAPMVMMRSASLEEAAGSSDCDPRE